MIPVLTLAPSSALSRRFESCSILLGTSYSDIIIAPPSADLKNETLFPFEPFIPARVRVDRGQVNIYLPPTWGSLVAKFCFQGQNVRSQPTQKFCLFGGWLLYRMLSFSFTFAISSWPNLTYSSFVFQARSICRMRMILSALMSHFILKSLSMFSNIHRSSSWWACVYRDRHAPDSNFNGFNKEMSAYAELCMYLPLVMPDV